MIHKIGDEKKARYELFLTHTRENLQIKQRDANEKGPKADQHHRQLKSGVEQ